MLYYLLDYINNTFNPPGFDLIKYLTVRSALAAITSLFLSWYFTPKIISYFKAKQIGEEIKSDGPETHFSKAGTPTMGGAIVVLAIVFSVLLWSDLSSTYILVALFGIIAFGVLGFYDDFLKNIKKYPKGLVEKYKLAGQIIISTIVAIVVYFYMPQFNEFTTETTLPFFKNLNFDFSYFYIPAIIFIIVGTSNAVNLTDGLDGLAIGTIIFVMFALGIISYVTGNVIYADYLNILYLPGSGELTIFIAAIIGASLGFLWYNFYPAQIFMGDTGSLALGGILAILAVLIKKELLLPILGGVYLIETASVIIQRTYFKYAKKRFGEGKRVFLMAPIHHHFEKKGWTEPKIVIRFYIITIILTILSLASFKIR